ncbi:MAG: DUF459 domain-containing protein [Archangium sp.]|nr:DUF459 domain-containing protein [Archangium sp.]MDP3152134.1 DUF459 domain-containing protein [Archangium sp.]MDP3574984.1 DUF459 domain-containing protein [Archangium sp.]
MSSPVPQPDGIAAALESYAATRPARTFGVKDTAVVLLVACVVAMLLDSEGLLAWAQRLEVGRAQAMLLRTLAPLHDALSKVGLDAPRRWAARGREELSRRVGGEGDPLLAEGWVAPAAPAPVPVVEAAPEERVLAAPAPPEPEPVAAQPGGGVLLLGDSMIAGSLGATLERTLARSSGLPVTRAAQLGTGLARPDVYDWMKVVPALLQRDRPRFVVVSLGANDATNLREGDDQLDYGEPRWRQVYAARVEAMMRALTGEYTRVLWLTLPPMRDKRLSTRAAFLNRVFAQTARKVPRVEFLEVDLLIGDPQRQFATFVQAPDGRLLRYRLDDGVHLAPAGSRAVAVWVRDWVRERAEKR